MMETAGSPPDTKPSRDRWLYLILLLALALRTYHLAYPFWDYFASRQTFNLMVVREFTRGNFDLTRPQVAWLVADQPDRPSYFLGEFPLIHALAAGIWRVLPLGDWCARLVVLALSLAGLFWLYRLTDRLLGRAAARFAALAWAVLPFSIFFGRAFMSDLPALSLSLGAVDAFHRWLETRRRWGLYLSGLLGALALLAKPTVIGFGAAIGFLAFRQFRWRALKDVRLYLLAGGMVLPTVLWLRHVRDLAQTGGPEVIVTGIVGHSLTLWLHASPWQEQFLRLWRDALGPAGLVLMVLGLLWPRAKRQEWIFHIWFLGSATVLLLIPEAFIGWNDYYLLLLLPPAAGLVGRALGACYAFGGARKLTIGLAGLLIVSSSYAAHHLYQSDGLHYRLGTLLNRLTRQRDLIATASGNAADLLYFSGRRGWEAGAFDRRRIESLAASGARLFARGDEAATMTNLDLKESLDQRFLRLTRDDRAGGSRDWMIWSLKPPPQPLHEIPPGEIANPIPANFSREIQLLGVSSRQLLTWPASFEVTYYWQCLKRIETRLRVFAHVTNSEGQTVYQQDHWPVSGHFQTTQWSVGDVVRERYVVILPENLPAGRYQLRVGWFDPEKGARLPIVSPGISDGEDRARVAEIEVPGTPRYGWFTVEY